MRTSLCEGPPELLLGDPPSRRSSSSQLLDSTAFSSARRAFTACSVARSSGPKPFLPRAWRSSSCSFAFCSASRDTYMQTGHLWSHTCQNILEASEQHDLHSAPPARTHLHADRPLVRMEAH